MSIFRLGLLICCFFVLAGCTTRPSVTGSVPLKKPTSIAEIGNYTASGKILLVNGSDKQSGYFFWRRSESGYQFVVSTILGIDVFSLKVNENNAVVYVDGKEHNGDDPQLLLQSLTGQTLPLQHISKWLIGRVEGRGVFNLQKFTSGRPERFVFSPNSATTPLPTKVPTKMPINSSWSVHYQQYQSVDGLWLPSQIQISSSLNRIKLRINNWDLF
ncbi:outer membrane lipoprotein LolB [Psychrosphaera ytuae]|uniref:Outer-membrane lipoprotein LolB n=1 Tax=Psychrosphaera ytuae TaxID=2820710 RepID=A0A975DF23_9GAMM|nr:outer membrane lipoprotein LolB [Psychrosphaera ytuae]QTH64450.1 outer membrane lipoprotein LolB [Psychrosphaera ytuae]